MISPTSLRFYFGAMAIILGYAVLSHGGIAQPNWYICLLMLGLISAVYWLVTPKQLFAPPIEPWLGIPALLLPLYVACQLIPLPISVLRIISPARAELLDRLAHVGEQVRFAPISITPEVTSTYLFRIIAYTLVFLLVRELSWHSRKSHSYAPVLPLIAIAAIEAALALVQNTNGADAVSGTYNNKNHFAGLLEMALPLAIAVALALIASRRTDHDSQTSRPIVGVTFLLIAAIMIVGLVVSLSKMSYLAGLSGLLVMSVVAFGSILAGWHRWLVAMLVAALFAFVLVFLPSDQLMRAFAGLFADSWTTGEGRWPIFLNALDLVRTYSFVGCGLGNFQTGFLKFQTAVIDRSFTYAHNDYLQLVSELGVVGFSIIAALMLRTFWKAFWAAIQDRDLMARCLGLACVGAMTAIGLHSLVDFNTYIPANAFVLAWIAGIAASLPSRSPSQAQLHAVLNRSFFRNTAFLLSAVLIVFAPAWIIFQIYYHSDARAERLFCRFGICDTDAVQAKQAAAFGGNVAALPTSELVRALGRDPASPVRWCDLGEALAKRAQLEQARYSFSTALELGPYLPLALTRAAEFHLYLREENLALEENARVLEKTDTYDNSIFDWYQAKKIPVARILSDGLAENPRATQAYLRYWMMSGNFDQAAAVWDWMISRSYIDEGVARDYVNFLFKGGRYETAAEAWAQYLGNHGNGYLESEWLYNGDFESDPAGLALDWHLEGLSEDVEVARDEKVAHTGAHSLRVHFLGNANVNFKQTYETAFVKPGTYRFEAFVRTEKITTDEGIGFEISSGAPRLDIKTEKLIGTNDWRKIEQAITIPRASLLTIRVVRKPSLKFDSFVSGTAWIDSVRLVRASPQ